ncbi:MAG: AmmeMemoRadiSam system protein A [Nitrospirae bacterium]|nr:AmmeMemoRadiSam system protein A [Nitrospirota bacterium]
MVHTVHPLVLLAREAIKTYLEKGDVLRVPSMLTDEMQEEHGVFVSLKIKGRLRGCIGTYEPSCSNVAEEVIHNAIGSATRDPRFMPVTLSELENIDISVDVLTAPERIKSADELDTVKYGVIVKSGYKRGLLLPAIEGVDTVEEQIEIAKSKAGITHGEAIELFRFEVRRFK